MNSIMNVSINVVIKQKIAFIKGMAETRVKENTVPN